MALALFITNAPFSVLLVRVPCAALAVLMHA